MNVRLEPNKAPTEKAPTERNARNVKPRPREMRGMR